MKALKLSIMSHLCLTSFGIIDLLANLISSILCKNLTGKLEMYILVSAEEQIMYTSDFNPQIMSLGKKNLQTTLIYFSPFLHFLPELILQCKEEHFCMDSALSRVLEMSQ